MEGCKFVAWCCIQYHGQLLILSEIFICWLCPSWNLKQPMWILCKLSSISDLLQIGIGLCSSVECICSLLSSFLLVRFSLGLLFDLSCLCELVVMCKFCSHWNLSVYTEAARIIYEICKAIEFLHTNDIAHRDLKVATSCFIITAQKYKTLLM